MRISDWSSDVCSSDLLRALLAADHPAAPIARNLYRLSRLLKVPNAAVIRTEAALAEHWWRTADGAPNAEVRAAQRILSDLAECALTGQDQLELPSDSAARSPLLRSLTLQIGNAPWRARGGQAV